MRILRTILGSVMTYCSARIFPRSPLNRPKDDSAAFRQAQHQWPTPFQKLMLLSYRHPGHAIVFLLAATVFFGCFVPSVPMELSLKMLWIKDDPDKVLYENVLETFGSMKVTVVLVKDSTLFTPEKLERLEAFQRELDHLPYVVRVDSLFSVDNLKGKDGVLSVKPYIAEIPETLERAREIKTEAVRDPLAVDSLVSRDGSTMVFSVFLDEAAGADDERRFSVQVDEAMTGISSSVEQVFQFGKPYLTRMLFEAQMSDQRRLLPIGVGLFTLLSFIIWRSLSQVGLIVLTSGLSILWTLGFMGFFKLPMNVMTACIPTLLIAVGSTEDIHLFSEYLAGLRETGSRSNAIMYMICKGGLPLFLTGLTTFIGFLAIALNDVVLLKQFGIVSAFGLFVNPLITFLSAPVWLRYMGPQQVRDAGGPAALFINMCFSKVVRVITRLLRSYRRQTVSVLIGGILLIGMFAFQLTVDMDFIKIFKPSSPIREYDRQLQKEIAGIRSLIIHVRGTSGKPFMLPENLTRIAEIQHDLRQSGWCDMTISIVDSLVRLHQEMQDGDDMYARIPESSDLIAQYLVILPGDNVASFITNDANEVLIIVRHSVPSSSALHELIAQTSGIVEKHLPPEFDYHVTGESVLTMNSVHSLAAGQVISLSFTLIVLFLLMSLLFKNLKAGALSLIPNVLPIVFLFGMMGLLGISLNPGTAMVAVIIIGIAVDDTIHFMVCYRREMRRLQNREQAVEACLQHKVRPVVATSLGLTLGFGTLMLANLMPLVLFGFLSALVLLFALMEDLLITPIVLSYMPMPVSKH